MQDKAPGEPNSAGWRASLRTPMATAVLALGITQIVAWGTTLYALGTLGAPIAEDMGWSRSLVFAGLTTGLLASSASSTHIGRLTDRRGGRFVMGIGSILCATGLVIVAAAHHPAVYLAGWLILGPAMRMSLYDAAFAALVQVTPTKGRRAISYLTLFGGLASTIFWPIGHMLNGVVGWRSTLLIYAAINLFVCLPLHWWGLARREPPNSDTPHPTNPSVGIQDHPVASPLEGRARTLAMVLFGLVMSVCAFVFGAMAVHLPAVLQAGGLSAAAAVTLASIKGVAQVSGRAADIAFGRNLHPIGLGRIAVAFMPVSLAILLAVQGDFTTALVFIVLFGVSNGLLTIVRGAVPLALFGPTGYGTMLGILATPYLLMNALAPAAFALAIDAWGYQVAEAILLAAGVLAATAMEFMAAWYRRNQAPVRP